MEEFPSYHGFKFNQIGSTRTQFLLLVVLMIFIYFFPGRPAKIKSLEDGIKRSKIGRYEEEI